MISERAPVNTRWCDYSHVERRACSHVEASVEECDNEWCSYHTHTHTHTTHTQTHTHTHTHRAKDRHQLDSTPSLQRTLCTRLSDTERLFVLFAWQRPRVAFTCRGKYRRHKACSHTQTWHMDQCRCVRDVNLQNNQRWAVQSWVTLFNSIHRQNLTWELLEQKVYRSVFRICVKLGNWFVNRNCCCCCFCRSDFERKKNCFRKEKVIFSFMSKKWRTFVSPEEKQRNTFLLSRVFIDGNIN